MTQENEPVLLMHTAAKKILRAIALLSVTAFTAAGLGSFFTARAAEPSLRKVRVGYNTLANFQEYDADTGTYRGYSYDYMMAVAQYAGWDYEFVPVSYDEGLAMLEDGELDLMNNIEQTADLSAKLYFSSIPSGTSNTCLAVRPDDSSVAFEDFSAFAGLTVGLNFSSSRNSEFVDYCKDNDCMPRLIYYHSDEEVAAAINDGEIDACLISSLDDVNMRTVAKFGTVSYYFATTRGNSDLLQELNTAMNTLKTSDPYFEEKIYAKYHTSSAEQQTVISSEEKAYIAANPVVKVSYDPDWQPLSYTGSDGSFSGAMADVFALISERTGLQFEFVAGATGSGSLQQFADGSTQLMAGFAYDYTWAHRYSASVTAPFDTLTVFGAYKAGSEAGNRVAVTENGYLQYLSGSIHGDGYEFVVCGSETACLDAVLSGSADMAFLDNYQLEYYRSRAKYRDLSFKVISGEEYRLSIAVSNSADSKLFTIISKTLAAVGTNELNAIFQRTSLASESRSLADTIFTNRQLTIWVFTLAGFFAAVIVSTLVNSAMIRKKNRQLNTALNAKSDFLSNISHDMRTPLNGIIGYTNLAMDETDPQKKQEYLGKIRISGIFLQDLINDTLEISKIESGKLVLSPSVIGTGELIDSIVVPMRSQAAGKSIRFEVDTSKMYPGYIRVDTLNLQKIILNLLSNAVKFTPEGGSVFLTIEDRKPAADGCNCLISVRDTGIGISEEFIPKIFEPFTQERAPETRSTVGTGLGLSIVKRIVTLMRGTITVTSKRGEGTRFDVLLPIEHVEDYQPPEQAAAAGDSALAGRRVLLCEDNEMNAEIARTLLNSRGVEVVCAADGREGAGIFERSEAGRFDAILMDLRMPVMNGYEATAAIRALDRPDAAAVPIIAMSADAYEDDILKCRQAGMNGHIAKPVDPEILFATLLKFCGVKGGRS